MAEGARGRGGHRQRRARLEQDEAPPQTSNLAEYLKEKFAFGSLSATRVQEVAALSISDHDNSPTDLVELGALGNHGEFSNHCHGELMNLLKPRLLMHTVVFFVVMLLSLKRDLSGNRILHETKHAMVAPHLVLSDMYHKRPERFARYILGIDEVGKDHNLHLSEWWSKIPRTDPRLTKLVSDFIANGIVRSLEEF